LGRAWGQGVVGMVPFFDMLNHSHDTAKKNVDLQCFGDSFPTSTTSTTTSTADDDDDANEAGRLLLNPKDLLLVLTKDVNVGDELLTQYALPNDEESQLRLLLQYGIPPPPPV
jgi:hypothetical protein